MNAATRRARNKRPKPIDILENEEEGNSTGKLLYKSHICCLERVFVYLFCPAKYYDELITNINVASVSFAIVQVSGAGFKTNCTTGLAGAELACLKPHRPSLQNLQNKFHQMCQLVKFGSL